MERITTKIEIRQHLAEYAQGKWGNFSNPVTIPTSVALYYLIWDLLRKRPANMSPIDEGNLEIYIPNRREGKNPQTFNFLSSRSAKRIEESIEALMWAELHDELDRNKHLEGIEYKDTIHVFMCRYSIESLSEDAMLKNYYRWRNKTRRINQYKRNYKKKL